MIASYLDESFDSLSGAAGVFAVGGILGRGVAIFELDRMWERSLEKYGLKYFKASECHRGDGEFSKFVKDGKNQTLDERRLLDSIWDEFISLITSHDVTGFGVGVLQADFSQVIKDPTAHKILSGPNPYWFGYEMTIMESAFLMKRLGTGESVSTVCDSDEEHSEVAPEVYRGLKKKNPNSARFLGAFGSDSDIECRPLQAADTMVYEIRNHIKRAIGIDDRPERWQFSKLRNTTALTLIKYADANFLRVVVEENQPNEPLNVDHILEDSIGEDVG